jgi:hypothetical protein
MRASDSSEVTSQHDKAMTWATSWPTVFFAPLEDRAGNFLSRLRLDAAQNDARHLILPRQDAIEARMMCSLLGASARADGISVRYAGAITCL